MVRAEPDGQVLDPVDLGRPAVADRGQDVAVGHVGRGLAHPLTQARAGPAARDVYLSLWTRTPSGVRRLGAPSPLMPARGICHDLARPCPDDDPDEPDAAARAARADGADPLPPAPGRTPEHGGALRGEGQPAPGAAPRAGGGGVELRRGQPGRGTGLPRRRRPRGRPRLLQPDQAPRRHRHGGRARRPAVRRGLAGGDPQGRRGRAGDGGAVPHRDVGQRLGLAAVAQVRLLHVRGRRGAPPRRRSSGSTPPASPSTSAPSSATRPPGTRRSRPRRGSSPPCGRPVCSPGCSTSAAASRPRSREAHRLSTRTALRSGGRCASVSGRVARGRSSSPGGRSSPTRGDS